MSPSGAPCRPPGLLGEFWATGSLPGAARRAAHPARTKDGSGSHWAPLGRSPRVLSLPGTNMATSSPPPLPSLKMAAPAPSGALSPAANMAGGRRVRRGQDGGGHHEAAGGPRSPGFQRAPRRRETPGGTGRHDHHGHGIHEVRAAAEGRRRQRGGAASGCLQVAALSPQGPRYLCGGREADRLGGRRGGEGEQAGVCEGAEGQVRRPWRARAGGGPGSAG